VQQQLVSSERELPFRTPGRRHDPQVVLEDEGDRLAVGRELRVPNAVLGRCQMGVLLRRQVVEQELAGAGEQDGLAVGCPEVGRNPEAGAACPLPLIGGDLGRRGSESPERLGGDQQGLLHPGRVVEPERAPVFTFW